MATTPDARPQTGGVPFASAGAADHCAPQPEPAGGAPGLQLVAQVPMNFDFRRPPPPAAIPAATPVEPADERR